jgi:hypothetical protein
MIPFTDRLPEIVIFFWVFLYLYNVFYLKNVGYYLDTGVFFLMWGRYWERIEKESTRNINTKQYKDCTILEITLNGPVDDNTFGRIGSISGSFIGSNHNRTSRLEGRTTPIAMIPLHETSETKGPVAKAPVQVIAPVSVKTEVPVKAEGPVAKAAESKLNVAATPANPVVLSMTPKAIFKNVLDVVKNLCKREREGDEQTEAQHPYKKQKVDYQKCKVPELKAMLDNAGVRYNKKKAKKPELVELANAHL